jgi:hypothetical protein
MSEAEVLRRVAEDERVMYEVGRAAVEDVLAKFRDGRLSILERNNGCVIKEADGKPSDVIRLSIEDAVRIAMLAMADYLEAESQPRNEGSGE